MSALLAFLGSSTVGALIGGVFALLNKKQDSAVELSKLEHEHSMRRLDIELAQAEAQARVHVAEEGTEAARFGAIGEANAADTLEADVLKQAGSWRVLFILADAYRRFMRPAITTALLGASLWANYVIFTYLQTTWTNLSQDRQAELVLQALVWVTGQASVCVSYWMVSRGRPS